jgi:tripeptide aminopeptidase
MNIDRDRLLRLFLDLARIDSPSGEEGHVAERVRAELTSLGIASEIDSAGNVIATVPGVGEPLLLNAHMDSVQPCCGVQPAVHDGIVTPTTGTVLGADDKAGLAVVLEVLRALGSDPQRRRALELVFTVSEEAGLVGAKALDFGRLRAKSGIALDASGPAGGIWVSAPSQNSLAITVTGRAAHAGVSPEQGISAIVAASRAITAMKLGRIDEETTANIGTIAGGTASNIVPWTVSMKGEARSRDERKVEAQTDHMVTTFQETAAAMGACAEVTVERSYSAYRVSADDPLVQRLCVAARQVGLQPTLKDSGGGSDANIFNRHGIKAVVLAVGYEEPHCYAERLVIDEMVKSAEMLLAFVSLP